MAVEYIAQAQTVEPGANIVFSGSIPACGARGVRRRDGSGIVTIRGSQCGAQRIARFTGNIAIPTGGTVGEISAALTLDGEPLPASKMIVTPAAVEEFWNIYTQGVLESDCCCDSIAVRNTSDQAILLSGGNLIID